MKNFLLTLFISLSLSFSYAQTPGSWRLGFGVDPGIPVNGTFQYTLGGDIRLQKDFNNSISGTLTAGFTHFFEKDHFAGYNQYGSPYNVIPVKAGLKVFLADSFYLGGEAGVGFGFEQWGNSFLYSPSVGVAFKNGLDLSLKYEDFTKSKVTKDISLRLAYGIDLRKPAVHKNKNPMEDWQLGLSINPGLATTGSSFVLGADVGLYKQLTSNLEATVSTGATRFFKYYQNYFFAPDATGKYNLISSSTSQTVIPLKAGLRLYAGNKFYVSGEAGAAFAADGNTALVYSPSLGLLLNNRIDIGAKYERYTENYIPPVMALKLGYHFKL